MKNKKTKKLMVGSVLGIMMCATSFLAVGCTEVPLTQNQTDDIIKVVDNADKFMSDTSNALIDVNSNLDNLNDRLESLEDISSTLKVQDSKAIYNLFRYSYNRILVNQDNVWDNFKIVEKDSYFYDYADMSSESSMVLALYKSADDRYEIGFETRNGVMGDIFYSLQSDYTEEVGRSYYDDVFYVLTELLGDVFDKITYDNLVNIDILPNGNYLLRFYSNSIVSDSAFVCNYEAEITNSGILLNIKSWKFEKEKVVSGQRSITYVDYVFEYNKVTMEEVTSLIEDENAEHVVGIM